MAENYIVYKHTCPSGKVYIGITGTSLERRCGKNGRGYERSALFSKAIQKYGWENIKHEILFDSLTKEQAEAKEIELIAEYKSNQREYGYNLSSGGDGGTAGVVMSLKTRKKMSEVHKGKKLSDEHRQNLSLARQGMIFSKTHRQKLSEAKRGRYCGEDNPWYGKHPNEETRKKMRESHLGKFVGANNPTARAVCQFDMAMQFIKKFDCIATAERETGFRHISNVCRGKRKTAGGFIWRYAEVVANG